MPIPVDCPSCGASLKLADSLAGKSIKCPKCAWVLRVPKGLPDDAKIDVLEEVDDEGVQELEEVPAERERTPRAIAAVQARDLDIEDDLPEHLRDRILRNLRRGERLLWVGRPIAGLVWLRLVSFAVTFLSMAAIFPIVWAIYILPMFLRGGLVGFQIGFLATAFFVLIEAMALGRVFIATWRTFRATLACYLLTDRRAVVWGMPWHGGFKATNYLPMDLQDMRREDSSSFGRGTGDLIFHTTRSVTVLRGRYAGVYITTTHYGFLAITDVHDVEELVRKTLVDPYEESQD